MTPDRAVGCEHVAILDEVPGAACTSALRLNLKASTIIADALIRARVEPEVALLLDHAAGTHADAAVQTGHLLVIRTECRGASHAVPIESFRPYVPAMVTVALDAFKRSGYFPLVGDGQIGALDQESDLRVTFEVVFLRLVPLQGG